MEVKKKRAFTLTELLVVVVVIGVLAAVTLPKFSKVMETRKTTEAEELMSSVRAEQEKRCLLDKPYIQDLGKLSDILPSESKNFQYALTATGMTAQSKGKYAYQLEMPSYQDGRLCCENAAECAKLNKSYPLCQDLIARADYQSGAPCAGESGPVEIECSGNNTQACGCENAGTQSRTCNKTTGEWNAWGACSISDECPCVDCSCPAYQAAHACECSPSTASCCTAEQAAGGMVYYPNSGGCLCTDSALRWNSSTKRCECPVPSEEGAYRPCTVPGKPIGMEKRTWDIYRCGWSEWNTSSCTCNGECTPGQSGGMGSPCGRNPDGTAIYGTKTCNAECKWENRCPGDKPSSGMCGGGKTPVAREMAGTPTWLGGKWDGCASRSTDNCGGDYYTCTSLGFSCAIERYYEAGPGRDCYHQRVDMICECPA